MANRDGLIISFSWSLLGSICWWLSWNVACLIVCRFYLMLLFMFIRCLLYRSLNLCFLAIIFALIPLRGLNVRSRSHTLLIGTSLGTLFLSLNRCVCISSVLIRTIIVLFCLFLWFSIWSIVVLVTVGRRFLLWIHIVNSIFI